MDTATAKRIIDSASPAAVEKIYAAANWYNATSTRYSEGLRSNDARLLGTKTTHIKPSGSLVVNVPRHAAKVYRLRSEAGGAAKRHNTFKEEL